MSTLLNAGWQAARCARSLARRHLYPRVFPWVEMKGVRLHVSRELSPLIREVLYAGLYELPELEALERVLRPGDILMEMGTGLGLLATYAAKRLGNEAVFTYEANPLLASAILDTFRVNGVQPRLELCAVGPRDGVTTFWVEEDFWDSSTHRKTSRSQAIQVTVRGVERELARIQPTVLIIDIEGGELELAPQLELSGVRAAIVELHPAIIGAEGVRTVENRFVQAGFRAEPIALHTLVFLR